MTSFSRLRPFYLTELNQFFSARMRELNQPIKDIYLKDSVHVLFREFCAKPLDFF